MKKVGFILALSIVLIGCTSKNNSDVTSKEDSSKISEVVEESKASTKNGQAELASQKEESTNTAQTENPFPGYSDDQIEYARVVMAVYHSYEITQLPIEISVTKNPAGTQVLPFDGSVVLPEESITISASVDQTMAGTLIFTYISHHDGSISFYKVPNHYQGERYTNNPEWVKTETQNMLDQMKLLEIPTTNDDVVSEVISFVTMN
ncbi:hypothetical protein [Isobaculum melis]|uniref:Lipoprotein n=1 Tax=Isobaculum melis TaxID=142588 RepID=A0A1H9RVM7_9LACT|nr:hypothetical protein [Isobaculum melis]SER76664.1 hypothetical protein SAMN04488559_105109 [Isobaculum melis]